MSPASVLVRLAAASLTLVASFAIAAQAEIAVSGWGALLLDAPDGWRQEVEQRQPIGTVSFMPASGNSFRVMVSPLRSAQGAMPPTTPDALRRQVSAGAEHAKSQAVEPSISVRDFPAGKVFGSYFSATDRAPKAGEYKYMTQGIVAVEGLPVAFTILSNVNPQVAVEPALRMLQSARKQ